MSNSSNIVDSLGYLNSSRYDLIHGNNSLARLVNLPFKIGLSFSDATKLQYRQSIGSVEGEKGEYMGYSFVIDIIGYFFSNYAVLCFITAIFLNRLITMSALANPNSNRNNLNRYSTLGLSKWSLSLFHLTAILPLVYDILQGLVEVNFIDGSLLHLSKLGLEDYLIRTFSIFSWSHCIETFSTIATNTKPMEESDYTIFELSIQFYIMSKRYSNNKFLIASNAEPLAAEIKITINTIIDVFMAIIGRIIIHIVEMFNIKHYRLVASTVLNSVFLVYMFICILNGSIIEFPGSAYFRHFPKIFSILIVAISVLCYGLSCLIRKDPFGGRSRDTSELQYHAFMNNWWNHVNCTGEQEFSIVINKLALLLCKDVDTVNVGIQKEFPSLMLPKKIHRSFIISGYNNKLQKIDSLNEVVTGGRSDSVASITYSDGYMTGLKSNDKPLGLKSRIFNVFNLFGGLIRMLKSFITIMRKGNNDTENGASLTSSAQIKAHDYVTEKNYSRFLSSINTSEETNLSLSYDEDNKETNMSDYLLLPDDDISEDYFPDSELDVDDDDDDDDKYSSDEIHWKGEDSENNSLEIEEKQSDTNNDVSSVTEDLVDIILHREPLKTPDDTNWMVSMWNLLQYKMKIDQRLTRSQYNKINPDGILQEIRNNFTFLPTNKNNKTNSSTAKDTSTSFMDNDDIDIESLCVVCKTNDRNIVVWPCRCFALCEECRISLGLRGFNTCICCRSDVHGYSKLNHV